LLESNSRKSAVIYLSLLLLFGGAIISLPFINIDVTVRAQGLIRPQIEKQEIKAQISGTIAKSFLIDNQLINKGDTLAIFDSETANKRINLLSYTKGNLDTLVHDLNLLTTAKSVYSISQNKLYSPGYKQESIKYRNEISKLWTKEGNQEKAVIKNRQLFERGMTSKDEVENGENLLAQYKVESNILHDQYQAKWLGDLKNLKSQNEQTSTDKQQLTKELEAYTVLAPVTGHLEINNGVFQDKFIQAGQVLCVISPDTKLLAEVYVPPKDIGLIKIDSKVTILADAYNYNDWGTIAGTVTEISSDYQLINQQPYFKIKCSLAKDYLQLKNGTVGKLKKGITLQARFAVSRRTLLQLLTDNVNDWLNPNYSAKE